MVVLLTSIVHASNNTKCLPWSNQHCTTQPNFINLHPNEYTQVLCYYSFPVNLDRFIGSSNTLNDLSSKLCIPKKTEDLNLSIFNIIIGRNESKTLTNNISCKCKCKFDGSKCNSNQKWNNHKCW